MAAREDAVEARIERMREFLAKDPDDATLWFTLGRSLLEVGRPDSSRWGAPTRRWSPCAGPPR
jgi:cytochrome c-type biogenesis protein CcmH/NrfG